MSLFSFLRRSPRTRNAAQSPKSMKGKRRLWVEELENRMLPSGTVISGFVFNDANNNGLRDPGEGVFANNPIELRNASGIVIGSTVTDGNGFYQFATDSTLSTAPATLTRTASITNRATDWTQTISVQQFDPSLGTLTSVDIISSGTFTSQIQVESLDSAPSTITGTVSGSLSLTGPGITALVTTGSSNETFNASAFDGVIDFAGASGHDFGAQTAPGSQSASVTAASDLALYVGSGSVVFTDLAHATSSARGAGNLVTHINSSADGNLTVVYHYIPSNALRPGNYTIVQTAEPPGTLDGKESSNGIVLPASIGSDTIPVALGSTNSTNNNFAELIPASLAGFVYVDPNNNGVKDAPEAGIAGVTLTLTGANDLASVNQTVQTGADGSYLFNSLRPGSYVISETQPANYLDGKDSVGTAGGALANDQISAINLNAGVNGSHYDFGEILASSLSGFVYLDSNNDGVMQPGEPGIPGATVRLSGVNDLGANINLILATGIDGSYHFLGLRPGTYTIAENQPAGYLDGKDAVGSVGGQLGNDQLSSIALSTNVAGVNYNFGEILPDSISGFVYLDMNDDGIKATADLGLPMVMVTLTGTDDSGASVLSTQTTGADGSYHFTNLRPGTYSVAETQPAGTLDGKDTLGSAGGSVSNDLFSSISITANVTAINYNFGELFPSILSGFVYLDRNSNGLFDSGESGIAGIAITLSGTNDFGQSLSIVQNTGPDGSYQFVGLRPGTYTLNETQSSLYLDGRDNLGSLGGLVSNDQFSGIGLPMGTAGVHYDFGELLPPSAPGTVYAAFGEAGTPQPGNFDVTNKLEVIVLSGADPALLRANAFFIDMAYRNVLGRGADPAALTYFSVALLTGTTRFQVSQVLWESAEHRGMQVDHLYQRILHRNADPGSRAAFVSALMNGMTEAALGRVLVLSTEYQATHAADASFVAGVYADVIGRTPSGSELAAWTQALQSGLPRATFVDMVFNSPEVNTGIVDMLYVTLLQRHADAGALQYFVPGLTNHVYSTELVAESLLASGEYYARAVHFSLA